MSRVARRRTPLVMAVSASTKMGDCIARAAMLSCAYEWRLGFRGGGVNSESFLCSMRCAVACESISHLPLLGWRNLSEGALLGWPVEPNLCLHDNRFWVDLYSTKETFGDVLF